MSTAAQPDVRGLLSDSDFQALDPASQREALTRVTGDQSFANLSDADTQSFISRMTPDPYGAEAMSAKATQEAKAISTSALTNYANSPEFTMVTGGPKDPNDAILKTGTLPQKLHRALTNTAENLAPASAPVAYASPLAFLGGALGGYGASKGTTAAASALGANPDWADVAGDVAGIAGGAAGARFAPEAITDARTAIGNASYTPEGKLKTVPSLLSRAGTAAAAHYAGVPYGESGLAGWFAGDKFYKMAFPNPAADEISQAEWMNKGYRPAAEQGVGVPGSAQQESGYYPGVTKVPIRPTPDYDLTPQSVPGPDTSGKGNLLSPLAKKGDPRAAAELMRRGRNVLYVPAESYGDPSDFNALQQKYSGMPSQPGKTTGDVTQLSNGDRFVWSGKQWIFARNNANQ